MSGVRVLYVSSAIGLGHVSKDLAIVGELRELRPDVSVVWLAGHPGADAIADAGEEVLPESERWLGGSAIAEQTFRNGQLDLVRYVYRSMPAWSHNMRIVRRAVETHDVDIVVGDEAWEIEVPLLVRMLHLQVPFVLITDFVGVDALTLNPLDHLGAYLLNALWSCDGTIHAAGPHSVIFIGDFEDIADRPFGPGLPNRRQHARDLYLHVDQVVRYRPDEYSNRAAWRERLGYGDGPLVICSVGGTSIGKDLLELCGRAFPLLRERLPDLHMVAVCGPRLPAASVQVPQEVDVRGYVPRLFEHHACCDVAVGQCGASSTTELAALRTPFIYFPIDGHYEQELVAARLGRYGAGVRMSLKHTTPEMLASAILDEYRRELVYQPVPVDGARQAARHIVAVLERQAG